MAAARDSSCSSRELVEEISRKGNSDPGSFQPLSTDAVGSPAAARGLSNVGSLPEKSVFDASTAGTDCAIAVTASRSRRPQVGLQSRRLRSNAWLLGVVANPSRLYGP